MTQHKKGLISKINNFFLNILIGILSIILLITTYTGVQVKLLGQDYANFFGYTMFEVQTDSMEETIYSGDWIIVKFKSKVKLNDIVTYKLDKEYITHRVVEIHNGTYITKGDANSGKDVPVDQTQIVGKVTKILSGFGILRKTVFNPGVLIMLLITLFLFDSLMKDEKDTKGFQIKIKKIFLRKNNKKKELKKSQPEDKTKNRTKLIKEMIEESKKENQKVIEEEQISINNNLDNSENLLKIDEEMEEVNNKVMSLEELSEITEVIMDDEKIEVLDLEEEVFEDYDQHVDELEKTQFFRIIPVDTNELDQTLLEIAKNELAEQNKGPKEEKVEPVVKTEESEEGLTKIDLELLKNNTRKNKNMIDAFVNIKKDELNEIIQILQDVDRVQTNEPTIKNIFMTTYVHAKYYNYYNEKDLQYQGNKFSVKIAKILKLVAKEICSEYNGADVKYSEKVDKYVEIIKIIASLDEAKLSISEAKAKKEFYRSEITNYYKDWDNEKLTMIIDNIITAQKTYEEILKYFFKKNETNVFYLDLNKVKSKKDLYATELQHNVTFNKIYSEYIIDKTYEEGIIAEDKMPVLFNLLLSLIIENMLNAEFSNKYIVNLPVSLYTKEKKLWRTLKMIDDEYAKSHIIILIDFADLVANKKIIKRIRKSGYKFALGFKDGSNIPPKDRSNLYMTNIIFIDKKDENFEKLNSYIPVDIESHVIYDDIYSKFNNIEGE